MQYWVSGSESSTFGHAECCGNSFLFDDSVFSYLRYLACFAVEVVCCQNREAGLLFKGKDSVFHVTDTVDVFGKEFSLEHASTLFLAMPIKDLASGHGFTISCQAPKYDQIVAAGVVGLDHTSERLEEWTAEDVIKDLPGLWIRIKVLYWLQKLLTFNWTANNVEWMWARASRVTSAGNIQWGTVFEFSASEIESVSLGNFTIWSNSAHNPYTPTGDKSCGAIRTFST